MTDDQCTCDGGGSIAHAHNEVSCTGGHDAECQPVRVKHGDFGSLNDGRCEWSFFTRCKEPAREQLVYGQQYGFKYWYCEAHAEECKEAHPEYVMTALRVDDATWDLLNEEGDHDAEIH